MDQLYVVLSILAFANTASVSRNEDSRIIGGKPATISTYPFAASVRLYNQHVCSGAVINSNYILSAAQCLYLDPAKPESVSIRAGLTDLNEGGLIQHPKQILLHPFFNYKTFDYDVMYLKLLEPIGGQENKPIRSISFVSVQDQPKHGEMLTAIGWGETSTQTYKITGVLQSVELPYMERELCQSSYKSIKINITENMFCAGGSGSKSTWKSDTGGPVINKKLKLVGLVSWRAVKQLKGYPSVFTDLSSNKIRDFIEPIL